MHPVDKIVEQMKPILAQQGFISDARGAQTIRNLYRAGSATFNYHSLTYFGKCCFFGAVDKVKKLVEEGNVPDKSGTETPYKCNYAQIILIGVLRLTSLGPKQPEHYETLEYIISQGYSLHTGDIVGNTALHHAVDCAAGAATPSKKSYARLILESGAFVNAQNRFGETALMNCTIGKASLADVEALMEHGASIDLADANGTTTRQTYVHTGAQITAIVQKWLRKRSGQEDAPRTERACSGCGTKEGSLKNCSKCQVARYCSRECQVAHWPVHKKTCKPFTTQNTVTLRPTYLNIPGMTELFSTSNVVREVHNGTPYVPKSEAHRKVSNVPKNLSSPKAVIIKVQVPLPTPLNSQDPEIGDLLVYTKKRDFVCVVRRRDGAAAYDTVSSIVKAKGVGGVKAYFSAELRGKYELVVKVAEVLAEQPF